MSMSTHVQGFKAPSERWLRMKAAYDACKAAGIDPPAEVEDCVGEWPSIHGEQIEIHAKEWREDMVEGWDVYLADLPDGTTVIRFTNSY